MAIESVLSQVASSAMRAIGLDPDWDEASARQLQRIARPAVDGAALDLTHLPWASIDNDNSRDLDQLSVAQPSDGGAQRILVAIADVDALVARGTPIDMHAQGNTTSVYTAAGIFPMLPEKLSTDLTSLAQGVERLSIVIDMTIDTAGGVTASQVYAARVINKAKLAYDSVAAWLQGRGAAPEPLAAVAGMGDQLRTQDRVAQSMRAARHARGALDLQTIEAEPVFDAGVLMDLRPDADNRAKQLIEEFMVAANQVIAKFLDSRQFASLRRILRSPQRWDRIAALAQRSGTHLPEQPDAAALGAFLSQRRAADPALFPDLSLAIIKLLGAGEYVEYRQGDPGDGHFGLAVTDYTHSTAPNRRFPDLITQRLIKAALVHAAQPYSDEELRSLATHCSQQQKNAAKVERLVAKSAAAQLLAPRVGAKFAAIVTGASAKGTWARIASPVTEGRIVRGYEGLDVGDHVELELLHTDVKRGFIDFAAVK